MGTLLTLIFGVIIVFFAYDKSVTLAYKHDVDIMSASIENAVEQTEKFNASENGFFIAAALTEYDTNTEIIEDPRIGELVPEHYGWGYEGQELGSKRQELDYH